MNKTSLWVLIPIKDFVNAKQRLSGVLSPSERRALSQAMVEDMLECLRGVAGIDGILLVSDDPGAGLLAYRYGASVLVEKGHSRGLNAAVEQAAAHLAQRGASHMLVLHGDLPAISAGDIAALAADIDAAPESFVRLAPDRRERGSNGLLCSLPAPIRFAYGSDSFTRHRAACGQAGIACDLLPLSSMQLDIDTPQDLERLFDALDNDAAICTRTRAVLNEYDLATRLRQMQLQGEDVERAHPGPTRSDAGVDHAN